VKAAEYWRISPKDVQRIEDALALINQGGISSPLEEAGSEE
jgi:hypothetical protein